MIYRQGDVLIQSIDAPLNEEALVPVPLDNGRVVLAYGEVTGHSHSLPGGSALLLERGWADSPLPETESQELEDRFLRVLTSGGVDLTHEEHDTIHLPAGSYIVRLQREYLPDSWRTVAD